MRQVMLLTSFICLAITGCAHVFTEESLNLVDRSISYKNLRENPDAYRGKYVIVGGIVASVRNTREGGWLEVVQAELEDSGRPRETYESGGRFLAITHDFLDPEKYKQGREVSVVGEVKGSEVRKINSHDYRYPLVAIRELHLWRPEPRPVYYPIYPYSPFWLEDPYYWENYPYWYDPSWNYRYYRPYPFRRW